MTEVIQYRSNGRKVAVWVRWTVATLLVVLFSSFSAAVTAWQLNKSYVDTKITSHNESEYAHEKWRDTFTQQLTELEGTLRETNAQLQKTRTAMAVLETKLNHVIKQME